MQRYEKELKQKIVRLHVEEGRTIKSLSEEYSFSKKYFNLDESLP